MIDVMQQCRICIILKFEMADTSSTRKMTAEEQSLCDR